MKKALFSVAAAALALTPAAFAETATDITVAVSYDKVALGSEDGAAAVLTAIEEQAAEACMTRTAISYAKRLDRDCFNEVVVSAASMIVEKQEVEGYKTAPSFARLATTQVADAGQR